MLFLVQELVLLSGAIPLLFAWRANRQTSLGHAVHWAVGAWATWCLVITAEAWSGGGAAEARYVALCLTGCAGVAVLGARRPGAGPWNFVVAGLLAVLLLPFAESGITGKPLHLDTVRTVFLAATLAVGVVNYVPTRLAGAAALLGLGCASEIAVLTDPAHGLSVAYRDWPILALWPGCFPWFAAALLWTSAPAISAFDRLWLDFRNRYGFVWSQRLREQFNHSAHHAGWPVILHWQGLRLLPGAPPLEPGIQEEIVATLRALMKRFLGEDGGETRVGAQ